MLKEMLKQYCDRKQFGHVYELPMAQKNDIMKMKESCVIILSDPTD